ncbi:peptidoglycan recognition protein family protein [Actinacidiphila glaucinigra]|uniref:peptidoglycan recognition protein family protein n=1 Tax=Actinacidiphila glaucinigra TaxID=235986 RepID=UPI00366D3532
MAAPLTATAFMNALRAEGLALVEVGSWKTHNRNSKGSFGPLNGVIVHHTGPYTTEAGMVSYCVSGSQALPGPLCHGVIGRDGKVYLVGYGRANHAGGGDNDVLNAVIAESYATNPPATNKGEGDPGAVDGNSRFYGFECINKGDGREPWPEKQLDAMARAAAAICRAHGWTAKSVIGHLEWNDQKPDPKGFIMASMRARVAERLKHQANWTPSAPAPAPTASSMEARISLLEKLVAAQEKRLVALEKVVA